MKTTKSFLQLPFEWIMIFMIAGLCVHDVQPFPINNSQAAPRIELLEYNIQKEERTVDFFASRKSSESITFLRDNSVRDFYQQKIKVQLKQIDTLFTNYPITFLQLHLLFKITRFIDAHSIA